MLLLRISHHFILFRAFVLCIEQRRIGGIALEVIVQDYAPSHHVFLLLQVGRDVKHPLPLLIILSQLSTRRRSILNDLTAGLGHIKLGPVVFIENQI